MKSKFKFSSNSNIQKETLHPDLIMIFDVYIQITPIDIGISEGYRSIKRQKQMYEQGLSKCDGIKSVSDHNFLPSKAADFFAYYDSKAQYDFETLSYIAGMLDAIAKLLHAQGIISHLLGWGGNWDNDSVIITDQNLKDLCHVFIYKPE